MQMGLDNMSGWDASHRLPINTKNTKYMIFGNRNMLKKRLEIETLYGWTDAGSS